MAADARSDAPLQAIYPRLRERPPAAYSYRLLALALQRSGVPHVLKLDGEEVSSRRAKSKLIAGDVTVMDAGASDYMSSQCDVVPFPIDLGLGGCRLLIGRRDVLTRLNGVQTLADLQAFKFGQGLSWLDTRILRNAKLQVEEGPFDSLLRMLHGGRFDLLPLGIDEAQDVLSSGQGQFPELGIHQGLALVYPYLRVFYVPKGQAALAAAIRTGLERASADGSMQALLSSAGGIGPVLTGRRPVPARQIVLANPWLPSQLGAVNEELFHPALRASLREALASR